MIYRHYKGGLYYKVGFATRFSSEEIQAYGTDKVFTAKYTEDITHDESQHVSVFSIKSETGNNQYGYESNELKGVQTLYKGMDGNYWLRPIDMFNGFLDDGITPRFARISGEELFDSFCFPAT